MRAGCGGVRLGAAGCLAIVVLLVGAASAQEVRRPALDCAALLATPSPGIVQLCEAEAAMRRAAAAPGGSAERSEHWRSAAGEYSRAVNLLHSPELKIHAFEMLARLQSATHLANPEALEQALRGLAQIDVGRPDPLMRLAKFQEDQKRDEAAEETLFMARQQYPDAIDLTREMAKFFARRVLALTPKDEDGKPVVPPPPEPAWKPDCQRLAFDRPGAGLADVCQAEAEMRLAAKQERNSKERRAHLENAADYYRRAAGSLRETDEKSFAYTALVRVYSSSNLADPREAEPAVRQLMALAPNDVQPILRLATLQEEMKQPFVAEQTLVGTRLLYPGEIDVLKALSRFYARQTTTASAVERRAEIEKEPVPPPNQPDAEGNYRIGSSIRAPKKMTTELPVYPDEARVVELEGVVITEIWVDETGRVTRARLMRDIPMLEEAALAAVMQWRFEPAVVDGKAVPVRMTVTNNFTLGRAP